MAPDWGRRLDITVGVEEELQVVQMHTGALMPYLRTEADDTPHPAGTSTHEIHRCVIEIQTRICTGPTPITQALGALRLAAYARARGQGCALLSAGLHPFSEWADQAMYDNPKTHPHYAHLLTEFGDVARSALSFGMHVHLGLPEPAARMPVMNALRSVLPAVLALSASSPFFEGRDTGLQSWRHSLLGRYPRMGIPEAWGCEADYWAHLERLRQTGCLEPDRGLWEDLRLHHRYHTLEVRIADAVASLDRAWLIVALLQAEALTLMGQWKDGALPAPCPRACIDENKWRARRHGMDATWVDWPTGRTLSMADFLQEWARRLEPAAQKLGFGGRLPRAVDQALAEGTCAAHQRRLKAQGCSWSDLVHHLSQHTLTHAHRAAV